MPSRPQLHASHRHVSVPLPFTGSRITLALGPRQGLPGFGDAREAAGAFLDHLQAHDFPYATDVVVKAGAGHAGYSTGAAEEP